jgi:hypothetical protein
MRGLSFLLARFFLLGCSGELPVAETSMSLGTAGLSPSDLGSVMVLVLGNGTCARALLPPSPLDDPELEVLRHALFTVDGAAKHLSIPAERKLVFYVEAYRSADGSGPRLGRGCAEATLQSGSSTGVSITISADSPSPP